MTDWYASGVRASDAQVNAMLEALIDRESLGELLGRIAAIAEEKGGHILASYGDKRLAQDWVDAGGRLLGIAEMTPL